LSWPLLGLQVQPARQEQLELEHQLLKTLLEVLAC
jgi:hypothetical protein